MTSDAVDDRLLHDLQRLPIFTLNEERAERVRTRCHVAMARRRRRIERSTRLSFMRRVLEPALIGGLSFVYLVAVILDALRLHSSG